MSLFFNPFYYDSYDYYFKSLNRSTRVVGGYFHLYKETANFNVSINCWLAKSKKIRIIINNCLNAQIWVKCMIKPLLTPGTFFKLFETTESYCDFIQNNVNHKKKWRGEGESIGFLGEFVLPIVKSAIQKKSNFPLRCPILPVKS